ncbi:MAG: hypothetical protein M8844_01660 [marine benthic group bacterium]|nr:hypothetical protein [Gemmatimonadota bacterium]MCL7976702.1 hypothetical protein [Gemmatimonadota bacterium]MCL7981758.1 hypothetical protein [Gemmatimonadota bacterium]
MSRMWRTRDYRGRSASVVPVLVGSLLIGAPPGDLSAQDADMPRFPFGTPVVFVPVQSVEPLPGGGWPGGADGEGEALRAMDAELQFALEESRGAEDWALPADVIRRVDRNPMLRTDPSRMAYQGLLEKPDKRKQIYEPLHGELRSISALFDTRYVVLPISLFVEADPPGPDDPQPDSPADLNGPDAIYRAHLLLAMIDIRSSTIVWWGEIVGEPGKADSPALTASLAERVAEAVAPS